VNLLANMNPAQQEAIQCTDGPLLILAGAGSGKTRVLTHRIAYVLDRGIAPWRILAITFTNKAAQEMKERVLDLVGPRAKDVWLSTFHAFCVRILRYDIEKLGYTKSFVIFDTSDQNTLIKNCLKELNLDEKNYPPQAVLASISGGKNRLLTPAEFRQEADGYFQQKVAEIYALYQRRLRDNNAVDFDDLLVLAVKLLREHADVRGKYQEQFQYILVDEYQDTNHTQYKLIQLLAGKHRNICCVGDADQSIYKWRGADIGNILDFEEDYPQAKTILLEQNYRSTQNILDAANAVIQHNRSRKPKKLWTSNPAGELLTYYNAQDEGDEAYYAAKEMIRLEREGAFNYKDMAVLYRTNAQSRIFEENFMRLGIPYIIVGGTKFYERKEIKDMMAYLRVVANPADTVALLRIINVPRRGIGDTTIGKLMTFAQQWELPLFQVLQRIDEVPGLTARAINPLRDLAALLQRMITNRDQMVITELIERIQKETGYILQLEEERTIEAQGRIENLKELLSVSKNFTQNSEEKTLDAFLSQVALVSDLDTAKDLANAVTLMTLHSAKGLEFSVVFLTGMEEGVFPHSRTLLAEDEIEEERRLCYVGITRAEQQLYVTHAWRRTLFGNTQFNQPSRFLREIPDELLYKPQAVAVQKKAVAPVVPVVPSKTAAVSKTKHMSQPLNVAAPINSSAGAATGLAFKPGEKVRHSKWGEGTIVTATPRGDDTEIKVAFPAEGIKTLMAKYAPLVKI
jgi:DNA helicase II / ATP-dependent DNA helicase PcrA